MKKVFIDGRAGTTGLRIYERLAARADIRMLTLPEERRKDPGARREMLNRADVVFLCLPDDAAREAVQMIEGNQTVVLDTSTAHRTAPGWCYGFPELSSAQAEAIRSAKRIAVPGCHASGFIALVAPLIQAGILPKEALLSCHSVTGYSGGGKKMIAEYEGQNPLALLGAPRQYALGQSHKHLKEMTALSGLAVPPVFCPIVADFYSGMAVTVPVFRQQLAAGVSLDDLKKIYQRQYQGPVVFWREYPDEEGFFSASALSGSDRMEISIMGNEERILLLARYDNLGKGASGAALECLNLVMGLPAETGLEVSPR